MDAVQRKRIKRTVAVTVLFASALAAYIAVYFLLHTGLPCIFNVVTGLKCPGCGTTRGIAAILRLDFVAAARLNVFIFPSIVYIAGLYFNSADHYIKYGKHKVAFPIKYVDTAYLILLIIWWIVRNIVNL